MMVDGVKNIEHGDIDIVEARVDDDIPRRGDIGGVEDHTPQCGLYGWLRGARGWSH